VRLQLYRSIAVGWLIQRSGFSMAFGTAAALSILALPYFVLIDGRLPARLEGTERTKRTG
jgi:dipeptide/tripeptide permease